MKTNKRAFFEKETSERKMKINKRGLELNINFLVYLLLALGFLVLGVLVFLYLTKTDIGLIARIKNLFRFGG